MLNENIPHYRTGTLYDQKHAVRLKISTDLQCTLCHHSNSVLYILSGRQHQTISGVITERHNIACRHTMKAAGARSFKLGGCFV